MNARRYASLIVLGWMALAPAPAGAEDSSPPAPLPPRAPEAPKPPVPEESERLAVQRRIAELMARIEKAKDAGREREVMELAQELAKLKASLDADPQKASADIRAKLEAVRAQRARLEAALADAEARGAEREADALRAQAKQVEEQAQAVELARQRMDRDLEIRSKKEGQSPSEGEAHAKMEALRAQRAKLVAALADAEARGAEKDADALREQVKRVEAQVQELKTALSMTGEPKLGDRYLRAGKPRDAQPPSDDPAQMQQRLMRLQQAIRLLMEAGLPERANAVEKDAERLKAAIAARASASSPEGDLLREIHSLREEVQQMRRELHDLREMLERK